MSTKSKLAMASLVSAAAATTGCYSTWDLTPQAVVKLDGYRSGQEVQLRAADNTEITYRHDSSLRFEANNGTQIENRYRSIEIEGSTLTGIDAENGNTRIIDLQQMKTVQAKTFSKGETAAAITAGVLFGGPVLALGGIVLVYGLFGSAGGRPLRSGEQESPIRAPIHLNPNASGRRPRLTSRDVDAMTQAQILQHWARETSAECASVPAFLAIARDLRKASAPERLIRAALQAAREEATHAALCTEITNMHSTHAIRASQPDVPEAHDESLEALLERMALEAYWDGCVAEGAAAIGAQRSLLLTNETRTRLALGTIARDEHEHARLSREILAFCLSAGGAAVRNALLSSFEEKRNAEEARLSALNDGSMDQSSVDDGFLTHCGVPTEQLKREARIEAWERSLDVIALA